MSVCIIFFYFISKFFFSSNPVVLLRHVGATIESVVCTLPAILRQDKDFKY